MLSKETLIKDLDDVCRQTNAFWLCCSDVYTENAAEDEAKIIQIFREAGFLKQDMLYRNMLNLEYGGGVCFNYKDVLEGGYIIPVSKKYKAPLVFAGFETDYDQSTIYHECAHLYQRKYNFFNPQNTSNEKYRKYLKEVHANTFASMVMLLRAKNVLDYKKQQLSCLASDIQGFNQRSKKSRFYISLPIVMELIKAIRKEGRSETLQKFSTKDGNLDFEKIAFYTADFVKKYAYTPHEFFEIMNNISVSSYDMLKQKAKAWHILGERYVLNQKAKRHEREVYYQNIKDRRAQRTNNKIKVLPEVDEKAKVINAVCSIDVLSTRLSQDFNVYADIDNLIKKNSFCFSDIENEKERSAALEICDQIGEIYQKWHKNILFKRLLSKIDHPDTRDEVWALKAKKEKDIFEKLQTQKQY